MLVVAAWYATLGAPDPPGEVSEDAVVFDEKLAANPPDVLVIGNSVSQRGIDLPALAAELGGDLAVERLALPDARSPTWYAILANRVYAHGYTPKLLILPAPLHHMLQPTPDRGWRRQMLRDQMGPHEPAIEAKVFGATKSWPALERANRRLTQLMDAPKDLAVYAMFASGDEAGETLRARAEAVADPALEAVFDNENGVDLSLHKRVMPVAEFARRSAEGVVSYDPQDVLIPELLAAAAEHGTRVVFVRMPTPPGIDLPPVPPARERDFIELLNTSGAAFLDLTTLGLPDTAFFDQIHMNAEGRGVTTAALASELRELDALGDTPFPATPMPVVMGPPVVSGEPARFPLPEPVAGDGCEQLIDLHGYANVSDSVLGETLNYRWASPLRLFHGDRELTAHVREGEGCDDAFIHRAGTLVARPTGDGAWSYGFSEEPKASVDVGFARRTVYWTAPGVTLQFPLTAPLDPGPTATIYVVGDVAGPGRATIRAGAAEAQVSAGRFRVALPTGVSQGPLSLTVESTADGPLVLIRDVVLQRAETRIALLGSAATAPGQVVRFIGDPRRRDETEVFWAAEPLPPAIPPRPLLAPGDPGDATRQPFARLPVPGFDALGDATLWHQTSHPLCSPLVILEDGVPLP